MTKFVDEGWLCSGRSNAKAIDSLPRPNGGHELITNVLRLRYRYELCFCVFFVITLVEKRAYPLL